MEWFASRFELSRGAEDNLRSMEGLRGFAVFLVFLVHYTTLVQSWIPTDSGLMSSFARLGAVGHSGVDLFFVLSGYLIYGSLISRFLPYATFMRRRIQRLYPTFLTVFAFYVVLSWLIPEERKIPGGIWPGAWYFVENGLLLPGIFPILPMISVSWSLSYEMFYYVVMPVVVVVFGLRTKSATRRIGFFLAAALALVVCCAVFGGPVRLVGFIAGIVLFEVLDNQLVRPPGTVAGLSCLAAGLAVMLVPTIEPAAYAVKILLLSSAQFVLVFSCLGRPAARAAALFSWTPMRWLGNISYSYYLIHGVTLLGFFRMFAHIWPPARQSSLIGIVLFPITFAVTLVPASALFLVVERRFSLKPALRPHPVLSVEDPASATTG